jgi:hypothetical protein
VAELTARDLLRDRDVRENRLTELPQEITQLTNLEQLCAPVRSCCYDSPVLLEGW